MAAYDNLRAVIAANVYQNNNNEVTADMVKAAMNAMVASLGAEFQFGGAAVPTDNPGTPDYKVAYLAATPGTYSKFNAIEIADGEVAVLKWAGSWSKEVIGIASASAIAALNAAIQAVDSTAISRDAALGGRIDAQNAEIAQFEEAVQDQVDNYPMVTIEGNVTNAPDGEDLTTEDDKLKFANRSALFGKGYFILRRGKTFGEQVTLQNTIYEIRYDFDLGGASVTIPAGCVLRFVGGSLTNGTVSGNETMIVEDGKDAIFDNISFSGTFAGYVQDYYCGDIEDAFRLSALADCLLLNADHTFTQSGQLPIPNIVGNGHTIDSGNAYFVGLNQAGKFVRNVHFVSTLYNDKSGNGATAELFKFDSCENILFDNCSISPRTAQSTSRVYGFVRFVDCNGVTIQNITAISCARPVALVRLNATEISNVIISNVRCEDFETGVWVNGGNGVLINNVFGINTPTQREWIIGMDAGVGVNGKDLLLISAQNATIRNVTCEGAIERCFYGDVVSNLFLADVSYKNCEGIKMVGTDPGGTPTLSDIDSHDVTISNVRGYITDAFVATTLKALRFNALILYMIRDVVVNGVNVNFESLSAVGPGLIEFSRAIENISINGFVANLVQPSIYGVTKFVEETCTALSNVTFTDISLFGIGMFQNAFGYFDNTNSLTVRNAVIRSDNTANMCRRISKNRVVLEFCNVQIRPAATLPQYLFYVCKNCEISIVAQGANDSMAKMNGIFYSPCESIENSNISFTGQTRYNGLSVFVKSVSENYIIAGVVKVEGELYDTNDITLPISYDSGNYLELSDEKDRAASRVRYTTQKGFTYHGYTADTFEASTYDIVEGGAVVASIPIIVLKGTGRRVIRAEKIYASTTDALPRTHGSSNARPSNLDARFVGFQYFDETLGKPLYWAGSGWVDAAGNTI